LSRPLFLRARWKALFGRQGPGQQRLEGTLSDLLEQARHQALGRAEGRKLGVTGLVHVERPVDFDLQGVATDARPPVALRGEAAGIGLVAPDPQALGIRCLLNGESVQDSSTAQMVFTVAEVIAFISDGITLEPGDLILTGTPAGVGLGRKPPVYLADGDVVTVEIDNVGSLTNPVERKKR